MALTTQVGLEFIARNKATRTMNAFGGSIRQIRYRLRGLATGILAVAGVSGFGYMIRQQMKTIDSTAKLSDRLGIATESLIGLQHAASITGTNAETLNKSLEIFVRRLGEMTQGSGEAKRGLDMLGLTAEMLIHQSPAESFGIAADRIKQLGTQAEKTAAAYFLFGRAGSQMLNMLEEGSGGLREYQKEAEKLGLTFSRFDAAQIEAANDALTRARATMTGLFRQLTIELAPYIEILANRFTDFATAGEGVGTNVTNTFENMSIAAVRFGNYLSILPAYWKGFEAAAHQSLAVIYDIAAAATNLDILFKKLGRPGWEKTYKELAAEQRQIAAKLLEVGGKQLAGTYGQENAIKQFFAGLIAEAAQGRAQLESGARVGLGAPQIPEAVATMDIAAAQRSMFSDMKRMTIANYQFRSRTIEDLKQKYIDAGIKRVQIERWYLEQAKKLDIERLRSGESMIDGLRAAAKQMELEMKTWGDIGFQAAITFQRGFGSAFADVMMRMESFDDAWRSLMRSIAHSVLSNIGANIAGAMFSGIFGGLSSGAAGATKNVFTSPHGGPALQHGGEVLETGWAKVHRGETYSGVGGDGKMTIIIENKGQPLAVLDAEMRDAEDERILHLVVDDAQGDGPVRRMVKEVVANME